MFLFNKKKQDNSLVKIFTFYKSNINPDIPKYQKMVFDKFGISINQILDDKLSHAEFLNKITRTVKDTDYLVFFDIDCIPTNRKWILNLFEDIIVHGYEFIGAAQTANHLVNAQNLYISPFFCCISSKLLKQLNYPDSNNTESIDVWQNITDKSIEQNIRIKYWWPTSIEEEKWYLHHPIHNKFGLGTTYNDCIYHAFYSRTDNSDRFLNKCKEILQKQ